MSLSQKSISNAIKEIKAYKTFVNDKAIEVRVALANVGYETAMANIDGFDGIAFKVEDRGNATFLVGWSERQIKKWWNKRQGNVVDDNFSPILMAEFGSGKHAIEGHRGTYPTDTKNGLRDKWSYKETAESKPIWTSGETPTRPMYRAGEEMRSKATEIARQVFSNVE